MYERDTKCMRSRRMGCLSADESRDGKVMMSVAHARQPEKCFQGLP